MEGVTEARPDIEQITAERDGYRNAYFKVAEELGSLRISAAPWVRPADHRIPEGPSIFVVTLPKSGTVFIGHSLRLTLGYDFTSTLITPTFPKNIVWPTMALDFNRGGMVSVSHMQPDTPNIHALKRTGIKKGVLHVRDPRAALHSWFHFMRQRANDPTGIPLRREFTSLSNAENIDALIESYYVPALQWITDWLAMLERHSDLEFLIKTHDELARDAESYLTSVLEFYGLSAPVQTVAKSETTHFRTGSNEDWRETFTRAQIERVTDMIPDELWKRFAWRK